MRDLSAVMLSCLLPVTWSACKTRDEPSTAVATVIGGDASNALVSKAPEAGPTPATMIQLNPDCTLALKAKPRFWDSELGCQMLMDSEGRTSSNRFKLITFNVAEHSYTVVWSSITERKTVSLQEDTEYTFVLAPPGPDGGLSSLCEVQDAQGTTLYRAGTNR